MSPLPVPFRCTLHTSLSFPLPFYCSRSSRPSVLPDIRLPISQHRCGNNPSQADTTVVLAPTCSSYFLACGCWLVAASQMSPHPRCRRTPDVAVPQMSPVPDVPRSPIPYGFPLPTGVRCPVARHPALEAYSSVRGQRVLVFLAPTTYRFGRSETELIHPAGNFGSA